MREESGAVGRPGNVTALDGIHVVVRPDYWPFAVAIRAPQRDWWLRTRKPRPAERELERQAKKLRTLMASRRGYQ